MGAAEWGFSVLPKKEKYEMMMMMMLMMSMMMMMVMMISDTQRVSFTRLSSAAAPIPASRAYPSAQVPTTWGWHD